MFLMRLAKICEAFCESSASPLHLTRFRSAATKPWLLPPPTYRDDWGIPTLPACASSHTSLQHCCFFAFQNLEQVHWPSVSTVSLGLRPLSHRKCQCAHVFLRFGFSCHRLLRVNQHQSDCSTCAPRLMRFTFASLGDAVPSLVFGRPFLPPRCSQYCASFLSNSAFQCLSVSHTIADSSICI
jgi:hypothetical protein